MIDFESKKAREDLMNSAHDLCGECKGQGYWIDSTGNERRCSHADVHAAMHTNFEYALHGAAEYKHLQSTNVELMEAQMKFTAAITDLTVQLQRVGEATKNAWTPMSEIRRLVEDPVEGATLNEIRASVLREAMPALHFPMEGFEERCICGEPWDDLEETCAEARRVIRYADSLEKEDEEGETFA